MRIGDFFKIFSRKTQDDSMEISPIFRQCVIASGPLILMISLGMSSGYSAILLPQLEATNDPIIVQDTSSWIASIAALPMAFGCPISMYLMEKFGRKTTHLIITIPMFVGWLLITFTKTLWMMLLGRFLTGICVGLLGPVSSVYIAESSDPKFRSFLLGAISLGVAFGLLLIHVLGTFITWRVTAFISCLFPVVSFFCLCLVPESPSWLVKSGQIEEGQRNFYWTRGKSSESIDEFDRIIERQNDKSNFSFKAKCKELIGYEFLKPLIIVIVYIVSMQWVGVNAITFYSVTIIRQTISGFDEYLAMIIIDIIRVIMSVVACILLKRFNRRPLALISSIGTFVSLLIMSVNSYFDSNIAAIPLVALISYICFISIGFVPLPWTIMGEIFPLAYRNIGSGIVSTMAFLAFFSVVKTSPGMFQDLGSTITYAIYGSVALFATIILYFYLPETRNKPLNEIEDLFKKSKTVLK